MNKSKKYILSIFSTVFVFFHYKIALAAYSYPTGTGLPTTSTGIKGALTNLLSWLLSILGIIAIISFVISGLQYFLSAGDEKMAQTAKRNITYSILGVVVALSALIVIKAIDAWLGATSISF